MQETAALLLCSSVFHSSVNASEYSGSCFYIAVVILTWIFLRYRLALKGPNRVGVSPFIWGWKQIQFPKRYVLWFLEYRTMDKTQKPSSEPFRIYAKRTSLISYGGSLTRAMFLCYLRAKKIRAVSTTQEESPCQVSQSISPMSDPLFWAIAWVQVIRWFRLMQNTYRTTYRYNESWRWMVAKSVRTERGTANIVGRWRQQSYHPPSAFRQHYPPDKNTSLS
jgi:hypothetical protein